MIKDLASMAIPTSCLGIGNQKRSGTATSSRKPMSVKPQVYLILYIPRNNKIVKRIGG